MWDKIIPLEENQQEKIDLSNTASTGENVKHHSKTHFSKVYQLSLLTWSPCVCI